MSKKQKLVTKFREKEAIIGVVGLGYVGLPLAVAFADIGFRVVGIDVDDKKVTSLNQAESYIQDVTDNQLKPHVLNGRFTASSDYAAISNADAISICVPTPLRKTGDPDISFIIDAADNIAQIGGDGKLIVLESTTYPGTTEEIILPRLVGNGSKVGTDVFVAFSPERIDPGRKDHTIYSTPKVIGGITNDCLEVCLALYSTIVAEPVPVSGTAAAEMVKLLENTFRAVNIGLVNEVALMCDKLGLDTWEVVTAAATKPYGFMPFYPGPGLGGHCIPIDPLYLSWKLRTLNYTARFIELASEINSQMPEYVVNKVTNALNDDCKSVKGSQILILGVAYKKNVGDVRESPAIDVYHLLREKGANILFHDPHVDDLSGESIFDQSVSLDAEQLRQADCVVVLTDHDDFDWDFITQNASIVLDTRHAINDSKNSRVIYL